MQSRRVSRLRSTVAWWASPTKRPALLAALMITNLVLGAAGAVALAVHTDPPLSRGALSNTVAAPARAVRTVRPPSPPQPAPVSLEVPSLKIASTLEGLSVSPTGELAVPKNVKRAGWWTAGPRPGADGPAIIVGHVDSKTGPAVFFRLRSIAVGATILVKRDDNSTATFVVDAVRQYSKDSIPTRTVYGSTAEPALRLITCGGSFDPKTKSYRDNVVVFAHLETDRSVDA